ncbi:hypothetical protein EI42_04069 [Thermosporothrix hazakensis]|jgi:hypothetical protein|uniref:Uncharacterized protein n=2 Tax=Thermosporothrix TaxID=768650 RepID=A0A326U3R0_THEHA|nr:hypothetical protein [Thermosporothrix hazakensis]PZW26110.1 hypothetical protein EI42_04069 [Thermosporothrix hazakensis]BBH87104.1 hypothetical protein KTC_18550 [Thermosporothrix sp. COM3]GCE51369.1 hypothetical protein KTH_62380 [Thermosporothrix hazakensis]
MEDSTIVILELSEEAQQLLEDQGIDLYEELQQEVPNLRMRLQADPAAPVGSRDLTTVLLVTAAVAGSLTPLLIRLMNQITPPNREETWEIEETVTRSPDGTETIMRKTIVRKGEQRPWIAPPPSVSMPTLPASEEEKTQ